MQSAYLTDLSRESCAWDLQDARETYEVFVNSPQGRELAEWEEHHGQDD
jgi:hypothetical protein